MRVSMGVDLHKGQFAVYWRAETGEGGRFERYLTSEIGHRAFERQLKKLREAGHAVPVESTGTTCYFKRRVEACGVAVKNQLHGLLPGLGIETSRGSLQS